MAQHDLPHTCFYCENLLRCEYLGDSHGVFVPEKVITEEQPRECPEWAPVGAQQKSIRETMYGIQGEGCLRVLHSVSKIIMKDLDKQVEEGDIDVSEMPDFVEMRVDGMAVDDREAQLRYEHDEDGNVVVDEDGRKRPRPSYVLRKFACDPSGTIGLDHSVGMGWNNDQVIKFILDSEVEQGLIERPKKLRGKPQKQKLTKAAKEAAPKETSKMAGEGRRVLINRGGKKNTSKKEPEKVAQPPRRGKGAGTKKAAEAEAEAPAEVAASGDLQELLESIKAASQETNQMVIDKLNEIGTIVDAQHQRLEAIEGALEIMDQKIVDAPTILHDVMVEAGMLEGADPKIDEENGILSYLPDPE